MLYHENIPKPLKGFSHLVDLLCGMLTYYFEMKLAYNCQNFTLVLINVFKYILGILDNDYFVI